MVAALAVVITRAQHRGGYPDGSTLADTVAVQGLAGTQDRGSCSLAGRAALEKG